MKTQWAFCAGLTGLAAGLFLGLAFAPRSGRETQLLVKQKTRDGLDKLRASAEHLQDRATDAFDAGKIAYQNAAAQKSS